MDEPDYDDLIADAMMEEAYEDEGPPEEEEDWEQGAASPVVTQAPADLPATVAIPPAVTPVAADRHEEEDAARPCETSPVALKRKDAFSFERYVQIRTCMRTYIHTYTHTYTERHADRPTRLSSDRCMPLRSCLP
jgi:hypothetical protein